MLLHSYADTTAYGFTHDDPRQVWRHLRVKSGRFPQADEARTVSVWWRIEEYSRPHSVGLKRTLSALKRCQTRTNIGCTYRGMSTQRMQLNFEATARGAMAKSHILVPAWLPDGRRIGNEWVARNPTRPDRSLGSFKINLKSGRWADFATGDAGGDLISLRAYLDRTSQLEAALRVVKELGL